MTKLNPLNIDYTEILKKAQDRSDNLGILGDTLHRNVTRSIDGLNAARDMVCALSVVYERLDEEGRAMLPADVRKHMGKLPRDIEYLNNLIGTASHSGLFNLRQYGMGRDTDDQIDSIPSHFPTETPTSVESNAEVLRPTHPKHYPFRIEFDPTWSDDRFTDGAWVAYIEGENAEHTGSGADPTAAYRDWLSRN